jgi:hypothetical protein
MRDKDKALDTLTREELGLDAAELGGNPWSAAAVSFCLFSVGAIFLAIPFLWAKRTGAIVQCVLLSGLGLGAIGVFTSLFNGRSPAFAALRQVIVGMVAAGLPLLWAGCSGIDVLIRLGCGQDSVVWARQRSGKSRYVWFGANWAVRTPRCRSLIGSIRCTARLTCICVQILRPWPSEAAVCPPTRWALHRDGAERTAGVDGDLRQRPQAIGRLSNELAIAWIDSAWSAFVIRTGS